MAGAGYKLFNTGDVLTAAQVNTYLQEQTVMVFANSTARTTALSGVLAEGMMSYLQDTNSVEVYNGSSWVALASGDVTEVQAGTGISVASGTGPIPVVTNTMATAINAAGDLIYGTANDTFTRLGIGTAGQVLKVNSGATAPEWGSASSSFNTGYAYTSSSQNTTSTTYVDLATVTSVTVTTGTKALVTIKAMMSNNGVANVWEHVSFAVSGATTVAAADERSISAYHQAANNNIVEAGAAFVITGLTAGSNTFTLKFSAQGGGAGTTAYFERRSISVVDLGS